MIHYSGPWTLSWRGELKNVLAAEPGEYNFKDAIMKLHVVSFSAHECVVYIIVLCSFYQ